MKNIVSVFILSFFMSVAVLRAQAKNEIPHLGMPVVPAYFLSKTETEELQWGCPVENKVEAKSKAKAVAVIRQRCIDSVEAAAAARPGVVQVYMKSLDKAAVTVKREKGQFVVVGTFFIHTWAMLAPVSSPH